MNKKIFNLTILTFIFVMTIFSAGCDSDSADEEGEKKSSGLSLPSDYVQTVKPINEKVAVDVYFDATVSMRGYTTLAAGNVYRTLPDILTDVGSSMGEVKFYKFGAEIKLLENRDHRKFSSPDPYVEVITAVQNVVDSADTSHLSIIVTDLFESDSDWSSISRKIREKYFANHLAVAVVGIKNSFEGEIFDVGLNAAKFHYTSYDYPYKFRPFYMLVMGNETAIERFLEKFKERQTLPNETKYLLLSENLATESNDFSSLPILDLQNFFNDNRLDIADNSIKEFGLDKFSSPASYTVQFDYKPQFGACPLNFNEIVNEVKVFYLEENEWQAMNSNDVKIDIKPLEGKENSFAVTLTLTPERTLKEGRLNFIHAALTPSEKGYLLPEWVRAWNMPNVDVDAANFEGSKTINLIHVIGSMKDSVFAVARPTIVNMNFLIDAR